MDVNVVNVVNGLKARVRLLATLKICYFTVLFGLRVGYRTFTRFTSFTHET